jgi:hypothetical protein
MKVLSMMAAVGALALTALTYSGEARAQIAVPPTVYIASYEPVYYNGYAHYWYGGRWYYRDHGAWRWYDHEPRFLYDRRGEWARHAHRWR